jgi:hypothetical protein
MIEKYVGNGLKVAILCCRRIEVKIFIHVGSKLRCNVQKQLPGVGSGHSSENLAEI